MSYKKKTWQEKLEDMDGYPCILKLERNYPCYNSVHKMGAEVGDDIVLVNPSEVVALMKSVPYGKLITIVEICKTLAENHHVKGCCSLTAGIFISTAAKAVEEAKGQNIDLGIPYWRTLKSDGFLNGKFPGGAESHKALLEGEGFTVISRGKKFQVKDYLSFLVKSY